MLQSHLHIVGWEPEGRNDYSMMFCWEPEGHYGCTKYMAIAPFWFSMEHHWSAIMPFWLSTDDIVSWEPEGHYHYSMIFHWEPEGRYGCTKSMVIAPFSFSMEHHWIMIMPFWLSTDDIKESHKSHIGRFFFLQSKVEWKVAIPMQLWDLCGNYKVFVAVTGCMRQYLSKLHVDPRLPCRSCNYHPRSHIKLPGSSRLLWQCHGILVCAIDTCHEGPKFKSHLHSVLLSFSKTLYQYLYSPPGVQMGTW